MFDTADIAGSVLFLGGPLPCLPTREELCVVVSHFDHCLGQSDCSFLLDSAIGPEVVTHLKQDQSQPFCEIFCPAAARDGIIWVLSVLVIQCCVKMKPRTRRLK